MIMLCGKLKSSRALGGSDGLGPLTMEQDRIDHRRVRRPGNVIDECTPAILSRERQVVLEPEAGELIEKVERLWHALTDSRLDRGHHRSIVLQ